MLLAATNGAVPTAALLEMLEVADRHSCVMTVAEAAAGAVVPAGNDRRGHDRIRVQDLDVDLRARRALVRGHPVDLTAREFDLLVFLLLHPQRAFSREELLEYVWGYTCGSTATVTVHVRRLRSKVERNASSPLLIQTVRGVGYRFEPPVDYVA